MVIMPIEFSLAPDRATTTTHSRLAHHTADSSLLYFPLPGDVAQDSIGPSGAGRVGKIYGLAEISARALAVRDADGV